MNVRFCQFAATLGVLGLVLSSCQTQQQIATTPGEEVQEPAGQTTPDGPKDRPGKKDEGKKDGEKTKPAPQYKPVVMGPYVPKTPGKRVACVSVPGPYVALTFDDGPHATYTPRILNILKAHGAHATFFVAGENAVGHKNILARAVAEGHEIGAHTYSHINLCRSSDERIDREMSRTAAIITQATGKRPVIMRPPYGATNARLVDKMYSDYGMTSILWDVDTNDWRHPGVSTVISRAVTNARPGSIILVHDIHGSTADAVEGIVTGLQARGFTLVTVSKLLALAGKGPAPAPTPAGAEPQGDDTSAETQSPAENPEGDEVTPDPASEPAGEGGASISGAEAEVE